MLRSAVLLLLLAGCDSSSEDPRDSGVDAPRDDAGTCVAPTFEAAQRVETTGYDGDAMEAFVSRDGQFLFFNSRDLPAPDDMDIHFAERVDDLTFSYRGPLPGANSDLLDGVPSMDDEGTFFFVSLRTYDTTFSSVYRGRFDGASVLDVALVDGLSRAVPGEVNFDAEISADGRTLISVDGVFDSSTNFWSSADLFVATSADGSTFARDTAETALLDAINTDELEYAPALSRDGLLLMFTRLDPSTVAPQIHASVRSSTSEPFCASVAVPTPAGFVEAAALSPSGDAFYFHFLESGRFVLYRMAIR